METLRARVRDRFLSACQLLPYHGTLTAKLLLTLIEAASLWKAMVGFELSPCVP